MSIDRELASPDWDPIENHFGCKVSHHLKKHYADRELLSAYEFEINSPWVAFSEGVHVRTFSPLNASSVDGFFEGLENRIEIASGVLGGRYIIDPREVNPMVYLHYWDVGWDPDGLCATGLRLKQFLFSPRYQSDYDDWIDEY